MSNDDHVSVLLNEAVAGLAIKPEGAYLDATFGRGGHSLVILSCLGTTGRLIAIDRDPAAAEAARTIGDPRFCFVHGWFSDIRAILAAQDISSIDGALFDLGVSSPQINDPERGFSFRQDGPLDMRMDPTRGLSAAEWLSTVNERELKEVIARYGEERFAQSIARTIVAARADGPILRTRQLAKIVAKGIGSRSRGDWSQDPATRTFQAIRIFINQELLELSLALEPVVPLLNTGGRLAVISFHSLEDRMVKQFIQRHSQPFGGDPALARLAIATRSLPQPPLKPVGRAIRPSEDEIVANPRSRSATLRIAERTQSTEAIANSGPS